MIKCRLFNTQDFFNIINAQIASAFLSFKDGVEEFFFTFLEFLDFFLYGSKGDEAIDIDLFGLAKAVASSDGLHLHQRSQRMTVSAPVRFSPVPPAFREMRKQSFSP